MADDTDIHHTSQNVTAQEHGADSAMAQLLLASSMAQRDMEMEESMRGRIIGSQNLEDPIRSRSIGNTVNTSHSHDSPQPSSWQSGDGRSPSPSNNLQASPSQSYGVMDHRLSPKQEPERDRLHDFMRSHQQFDNMDGLDPCEDGATYSLPDSSPEDLSVDSVLDSPNKVYRCRLCNFNTTIYTQLQMHMLKHGGVKALKCPMCDYSTNDKSNFRRHRRLHMGNNPVSVFKCGKCSFSTIMMRKFKEHCSQVHNDDLINVPYSHASHVTYPPPVYRDGVDRPLTLNPALDLQHTSHHQGTLHGNFSASNALHSLLTGIHPTTPLYRRQTYPAQNLPQYASYLPPMGQVNEENHMASNYLRSIVSSIMNTHPPPRIPPSSTITSSGYYLSSAQHDPHLASGAPPSMLTDMHGRVKVKVEPPERDNTPDVSSSAMSAHHHLVTKASATVNLHPYTRHYSDPAENVTENNEASQSADIGRTNSTESAHSSRREVRPTMDNIVNTTVKSELVSVGVQCSGQRMKLETDINKNHSVFKSTIDQGVQCELITSPARRGQRSTSINSESEGSEQQGSRCVHCGVSFDDEVLYSIHIGCHSHTDPFVCNVCGKQCGNKYGFYSHIMRGHHY